MKKIILVSILMLVFCITKGYSRIKISVFNQGGQASRDYIVNSEKEYSVNSSTSGLNNSLTIMQKGKPIIFRGYFSFMIEEID